MNTLTHSLPKTYEPSAVEGRWYQLWSQYFTADASTSKLPYCIVLPPPNVTGSLHLGHALTATIQDILIRWKRMSGLNCLWLPGVDHAGIATQLVVERELMKSEKKTRHDIGREDFLKYVWAWKEQYGARIVEQHKTLGASLDWTRERFTMDAGSSEAVREAFVRLHQEGLMYRAQKLINWDPMLHTALSDLEVHTEERDGYLWHIAYSVKNSTEQLVVATTRPETMLGDTGVAVHPEDPRYKHLIGKMIVLPLSNREVPIVADKILVNPEFGTGVVKVTPAHDYNDYECGQRNNLPLLNIFDESAKMNENGCLYRGLDRFEARRQVLKDLKAYNLLVKEEPYRVPMVLSARTGTPIETRLSWQWYVRIKPLADPVIAAVEQGKTKFVPEAWTNTFFSWMRNVHDWCVSRQLWWGHRIPAWYPIHTNSSVDFEQAMPTVLREKPDGQWAQDPDVLDTWFSSALWPFSALGWPNLKASDLKTFYPNAVMETGHDIIFFWVARMMMMGIHFMGEVPFRTVYLHAMVRDEKGEKMSKTKGNVIDPSDLILGAPSDDTPATSKRKLTQNILPMGADALRFTLAALTHQGRDIKLSVNRIAGYKAFCNKLWNAARFALMNLDGYDHTKQSNAHSLADRWILSRLNQAIADTNTALENFQFSEAASVIYQFVWSEFCDWYIELAKGALYGKDEQARISTRAVLVFCFDHILRLAHPFMPFITEEIWQKLPLQRATQSICIAAFPKPNALKNDLVAETEMQQVMDTIEGIRTIRGESNLAPALKIEAHVQSSGASVRATLERWREYVMSLAKLHTLKIMDIGSKPPRAAVEIRASMEIYVPLQEIVDLSDERKRLKKEIERDKKEIDQVKKKFENPNYTARAPTDVVEKDRTRITELEKRTQKLSANLKRITPGGN